MRLSPLREVVFRPTNPTSYARGQEVFVYERGGFTKATIYSDEFGESTIAQPLFTDFGGRIEGGNGESLWVEPGPYDIEVAANEPFPWEAPQVFASQVDARDFPEIDPSGETECSTPFEEAMVQAIAARRRFYLPSGDYVLHGANLKSGFHVFGDPGSTTRLLFPIDEGTGGIFGTGTGGVSADDLIFEDLLFDGQQQLRSESMGNALLKCYKARRWQIRRCGFVNGTSYGLGVEGYPGDSDPNTRGPEEDFLIESCYFRDNGYFGGTLGTPHTGTSTSADNIDIKSSDRFLIKNIYSTGASDKGLNPRCRSLTVINAVLEDNAVGGDFNSHRPGPGEETSGPANDSRVTLVGVIAKNNIGTGIAVTSTTGQSDTHVTMIGCETEGNGGNGIGTTKPPEGGAIYLHIFGGSHIDNNVHGVSGLGCKEFVCQGVRSDLNGENGFLAEESPGHRFIGCSAEGNKGEAGFRSKSSPRGIMDNNESSGNARGFYATNLIGGSISHNVARKSTGNGIVTDGTSDEYACVQNTMEENGTAGPTLVGVKAIGAPNIGAPSSIVTLASGEEITLPIHSDVIQLTGTAEVKKIIAGRLGRIVTIKFSSTAKLVDGSNLTLIETITGSASTAVMLVCTGANWQQLAPKAVA